MYLYKRISKGHLYEAYYCEASCFRGVKAAELERLVLETLAAALTPEKLESYRDDFLQFVSGAEVTRRIREDQLQARLKEIEQQIDNITAAIARGVLSDALIARLNGLEDEKRMLTGELAAADETSDGERVFLEILKVSAAVRMILLDPEAPKETKKTALDSCVRSILVSDDGRILINTTLPGLLCRPGCRYPERVVGDLSGDVSAPPDDRMYVLQLPAQLMSFL